MPVHPKARVGFQRAAGQYERSRPETPPEAIDALVRTLRISPRSTVLELGAGTGKLTRLLAPRAGLYVAVEPVPAMRDQFQQTVPTVPLISAVAEQLPFRAACADAVVAAQAFHWFDAAATMGEMRRVLRPDGGVGLLWNVRDLSVDWVQKTTEIIDRYDDRGPRFRDYAWSDSWARTPGFEPLVKQSFGFVQRLDREAVVDRFLSISFIASLEENRHAAVEAALRQLFDSHPQTAGRAVIELPYQCEIYTSRPTAR